MEWSMFAGRPSVFPSSPALETVFSEIRWSQPSVLIRNPTLPLPDPIGVGIRGEPFLCSPSGCFCGHPIDGGNLSRPGLGGRPSTKLNWRTIYKSARPLIERPIGGGAPFTGGRGVPGTPNPAFQHPRRPCEQAALSRSPIAQRSQWILSRGMRNIPEITYLGYIEVERNMAETIVFLPALSGKPKIVSLVPRKNRQIQAIQFDSDNSDRGLHSVLYVKGVLRQETTLWRIPIRRRSRWVHFHEILPALVP